MASAIEGAFVPTVPQGSLLIIMSVLGAVVMPHNLFLHSEIVQSREIHLEGDERIQHMLKYEFIDTLFSMDSGVGYKFCYDSFSLRLRFLRIISM